MKKTYKFEEVPLSERDRFLFDVLLREYKIKKLEFDEFVLRFVCPLVGLKKENLVVSYDLSEGTFTYEDNQQPQPENKPGEGGDTKAPAGGDVQRPSESNG